MPDEEKRSHIRQHAQRGRTPLTHGANSRSSHQAAAPRKGASGNRLQWKRKLALFGERPRSAHTAHTAAMTRLISRKHVLALAEEVFVGPRWLSGHASTPTCSSTLHVNTALSFIPLSQVLLHVYTCTQPFVACLQSMGCRVCV